MQLGQLAARHLAQEVALADLAGFQPDDQRARERAPAGNRAQQHAVGQPGPCDLHHERRAGARRVAGAQGQLARLTLAWAEGALELGAGGERRQQERHTAGQHGGGLAAVAEPLEDAEVIADVTHEPPSPHFGPHYQFEPANQRW